MYFSDTRKNIWSHNSSMTSFRGVLAPRMVPDRFARSSIRNIYYDTPDFRLIRRSLDRPPYKEKLRLRTYGTPAADSEVFLEIKKKFDHIVYKRRIGMPYAQAVAYLDGRRAAGHTQIAQEIEWFRAFYRDLRPAMFIYYDRFAIVDREQPDLRITFDSHIRWRADRLDLSAGTDGAPLLAPGHLPDGDQDPAGGAVLAVARAERGGHFPDALL